jgi:hypothetical protein
MYVAVHAAGASHRKNDQPRLVGQRNNFRVGLRVCALAGWAFLLPLACEPKLVVGKWTEARAGTGGGGSGGVGGSDAGGGGDAAGGGDAGGGGEAPLACSAAAGASDGNGSMQRVFDPLALPWSTGFENGFCDYAAAAGYCYGNARASFEIVSSPVHSGNSAAAFSIVVDDAFDGLQARCVRQGQLPEAAFYSAFFFIPSAPSAATNWNLIHFRGGGATGPLNGLWDVSVHVGADGSLHLFVFDFLRMATREATNVPALPIGSWFQIEVYLKRAADATGAFSLFQDGELGLELTNLSTDNTSYGQWYVGNLAVALTPNDLTLYVDDVSIREAP